VSILVRFAPASATVEQYDEVVSRLEESGDDQPDGRELHVCFVADGKVRVSEVWDSSEKFEAHGEKLMPVLADVGVEPGEPEQFEVHNVIKR
jgi:quinol monooxygenase YgiN